ncbi:hypothetical protein ACFL0G_05800 [Candidatus Zixiibacteriota bacterium]
MSDTIIIIGCLAFLFVVLPAGVVVGYRYRNRLFSNVFIVSETVYMNFQSQLKKRAMEQVQFAREDEKEEDDSGAPLDLDPQ